MTLVVPGAGVTLTLVDLDRSERDLVWFTARAEGDGLSAEVSVETLHGDSLDTFAAGLDRDFRGWTGTRTWTSFRSDLELSAAHTGRVVELVWTLRRHGWECTVRTPVTPGEELRRFSADVAEFLVS
ncbi:DUF6228 family protein [Amycolatopsis eburnea]|uniref:Uncharacterized protein n=1 Tax=Amycolatopsis eburnea TaxID=2267691 RepID=A0A3R9KHG4_9PSEU|nr:DUF6228 family protein [Amycolatopsis eburnea]RSD13230.1 hypothetical protein EIY87_26095 [Amycolatopsis eburnea]